ncbi:hypothetical protein, partial [Actinomadura yumaensis]
RRGRWVLRRHSGAGGVWRRRGCGRAGAVTGVARAGWRGRRVLRRRSDGVLRRRGGAGGEELRRRSGAGGGCCGGGAG